MWICMYENPWTTTNQIFYYIFPGCAYTVNYVNMWKSQAVK